MSRTGIFGQCSFISNIFAQRCCAPTIAGAAGGTNNSAYHDPYIITLDRPHHGSARQFASKIW
jgi:hypothetical protein